jgi:hypothetical protein
LNLGGADDRVALSEKGVLKTLCTSKQDEQTLLVEFNHNFLSITLATGGYLENAFRLHLANLALAETDNFAKYIFVMFA